MANQTGLKLGVLAALALWCGSAQAQSFNIDIDGEFGPPQAGAGAPSSGFGAAANQPGVWNKIPAQNIGNRELRGLDGALTSARIVQGGLPGGSGGNENLSINTGDYALLLNDARSIGIVGSTLDFSIEGLENGSYSVFTYAVAINSTQIRRTGVKIPQASIEAVIASGPMPGNQLIDTVTHTSHSVTVTQNRFTVQISSLEANSWFNGMQIVHHPVPEPISLVTISTGFLILIRRGRQRRERA